MNAGLRVTARASAANPHPNLAKRMERGELAPAFKPHNVSRERRQAGRTPYASRHRSVHLLLSPCICTEPRFPNVLLRSTFCRFEALAGWPVPCFMAVAGFDR